MSLDRHGQLTAVHVYSEDNVLQVYDGFKRLNAARRLQWKELEVHCHDLSAVEAKVRIAEIHSSCGLSELEQGWLVRSLVREHAMTQGAVGERLGRHKSWVCRRLMLVEALEPTLQANVRLGLLAPRAAVVLAALPRGNQSTACELVMQWGLTVRQTELVVSQILECSEPQERESLLARWRGQSPAAAGSCTRGLPRKARSEVDWMSSDITTLQRCAARLQARLMANTLCTCPAGAQQLMTDALRSLKGVLDCLIHTMDQQAVLSDGR